MEAEAANAISKADWHRFRRLMPRVSLGPVRVPRALVQWVHNPMEDHHLGERILRELGVRRSILGHHGDYC